MLTRKLTQGAGLTGGDEGLIEMVHSVLKAEDWNNFRLTSMMF